MTAESQQVFGVDVDALSPGAPAIIDATTLGYPAESLNDIPAGDYWVQAVLNIYETFHLGNGRTLKLPPDKGEGQHWAVKPGNLYSKPVKMHLDPKSGLTVRISLTEKMPSVADNPKVVDSLVGWSGANEDHAIVDNKWVKHIRIQSACSPSSGDAPRISAPSSSCPTDGTSIPTRTIRSSSSRTTFLAIFPV